MVSTCSRGRAGLGPPESGSEEVRRERDQAIRQIKDSSGEVRMSKISLCCGTAAAAYVAHSRVNARAARIRPSRVRFVLAAKRIRPRITAVDLLEEFHPLIPTKNVSARAPSLRHASYRMLVPAASRFEGQDVVILSNQFSSKLTSGDGPATLCMVA